MLSMRQIRVAIRVVAGSLVIVAALFVASKFLIQQPRLIDDTPTTACSLSLLTIQEHVHSTVTAPRQYEPIVLRRRDDLDVKHVGILYICTGKYIQFLDGFLKSFERHFLPGIRKTYIIFTDANATALPTNVTSTENIVYIKTKFIGWPYETLYRFHRFNAASELINASRVEYLFFSNANLVCIQDVATEVLPGKENDFFVATLHPAFFTSSNLAYTYERNPQSIAYIAPGDGKHYFQGALYGGRTKEFMEFSFMMEYWVRDDEKRGIIPVWHDESILNRFLLDRNPLVLPPSYVYPEGWNLGHGLGEIILSLDKGRHGGQNVLRGL